MIQDLLNTEIETLKEKFASQVTDPAHKEALIRMTTDLTRLPIKMMAGEDVSLLVASLKAVAAMRGVSFSLQTSAAVQQAWTNIITKVVSAALVGAIA